MIELEISDDELGGIDGRDIEFIPGQDIRWADTIPRANGNESHSTVGGRGVLCELPDDFLRVRLLLLVFMILILTYTINFLVIIFYAI